jgi:hypothetical protein
MCGTQKPQPQRRWCTIPCQSRVKTTAIFNPLCQKLTNDDSLSFGKLLFSGLKRLCLVLFSTRCTHVNRVEPTCFQPDFGCFNPVFFSIQLVSTASDDDSALADSTKHARRRRRSAPAPIPRVSPVDAATDERVPLLNPHINTLNPSNPYAHNDYCPVPVPGLAPPTRPAPLRPRLQRTSPSPSPRNLVERQCSWHRRPLLMQRHR